MRRLVPIVLLLALASTHPTGALGVAPLRAADHGVRLPPGFVLTQLADAKLAPDTHCLALDPKGRVVVSGPGYIRLLLDDDGDGVADRGLDFADAPKDGAMGLFWDKDDLYCVGAGGLRVYRGAGGAGRTRPSQLLFACRTGSEHLAHAVARGPDGWLYLLAGDQTRISKKDITSPTSPVKDPVAGVVMRFSPDFKLREVVADGLRNAYAMDWNRDGELFTFDSDNERCVSLPWYEPTRCYHVVPGGRLGWLSPQHAATWRQPPHFVDVVAPVATLGRGSPTGVVCYRHAQFPARYRGGLFLLDWTFGAVHFVKLERSGSSYKGTPEVFLRAVGDNGFAPTAAAVCRRTGDLFLSIGGRGTRGAVYRVRYPAGEKGIDRDEVAKLQPAPRRLDWQPGQDKPVVADATGGDEHARRRALETAHRHRERLSAAQRQAIILANAGRADRLLRQATARLLAALEARERDGILRLLKGPLERTTRYLAAPSFDAAALLADKHPADVRRDGARLVQLALGDIGAANTKGTIWEGYSRRSAGAVPAAVVKALTAALSAKDAVLAAEAGRALAMVEAEVELTDLLSRLTAASHPSDDIHALAVIARLRTPRRKEATAALADALLWLDEKVAARQLNRERNWPARLAELYAQLAARDAGLNRAVFTHKRFGRADHVVFARARGFDRLGAAAKVLARSREEGFTWSAELVALVGELPAETALPALRQLWGEHGLDEAILAVLTKHARDDDRRRFVAVLTSGRPATVSRALAALEKLPVPRDDAGRGAEGQAVIRAMRLIGPAKEEDKLRARLLARAARLAGAKLADEAAAVAWLAKGWPKLAAALGGADGVDVAGWKRRLAKVAWDKGDAKRGQLVYTRASCAACHGGAAALGPDLAGVAGRFSRDDLITAILQPSKDVSPRYRTTRLTTAGGTIYQGIIVYEANDSVLLLTGPGESVRLAHRQISARALAATSLMPAGLLDALKDGEIADLFAYLKSLAR